MIPVQVNVFIQLFGISVTHTSPYLKVSCFFHTEPYTKRILNWTCEINLFLDLFGSVGQLLNNTVLG